MTFGAILVPERCDEAGVLARQIRAAFETHPVDGPGGEPIRITVSIGIACYPGAGDSAPTIVGAAELALTRAQAAGDTGVEYAPQRRPEFD